MADHSAQPARVDRRRLFTGICLALIPTGASFGLVSNVLVQLKQQFILTNYQVGLIAGAALWGMAISLLLLGPLLEGFGLKNGARLAFAGHLVGLTLLISAVLRVGDPSAFWILMSGAAILAMGNGMIEVTGNPLTAALYPESKTTRLNYFHAFFPIGIILGGLAGFILGSWGGAFGYWPYQLAVVYIPVLIYGYMILLQPFPKTENAAAGVPVGEMFRYTLTNPLFLLMLTMMAITTSLELGPMRWIPAVLQAVGMHGILVLVWISGWMVVLRLLASGFVERFSPPGMLLGASILTGTGLFLMSFVTGLWSALAAATVFAWGVAFFFPTMVGTVSERMPKTGSLGIVLTAGVGLAAAGAVGVPLMGKLADGYLAEELPPAETTALLQEVDAAFPAYIERAQATTELAELGYREAEVRDALEATRTALAELEATGSVQHDATANALRAVVATAIPDEPLVGEANAILQPAEAMGGQKSFRYIAPAALILILVFGAMYLRDRRRGGYRAVRLERAPEGMASHAGVHMALLVSAALLLGALAPPAPLVAQAPEGGRLQVLFLGDQGHHRPHERAKEILPVLAHNGIDMVFTEDPADLDPGVLDRYHTLIFYNNQPAISADQFAALSDFLESGGGLVVLHSASASFQNSEAFIRLVGAAFKSHGTGTFRATRTAPDHPVVRGVPVFETWDETYVHTKHNPDRTVLEVRSQDGHDEPWTWVRDYGNGRVFYTAWGHDQRTWGNEGFQQLLTQALKWSAGDWALAQQLSEPQPALQRLEVGLPVYELPPAPWNTLKEMVDTAQVALAPDASYALMTARPGFRIEPYAAEPTIRNIIDFTWDERGRMWAVETVDYPNTVLPEGEPGNDRILILEDTNGDGLPDETTVFADGMNLATSLAFANGGLVVGQAPHMLFFRDTDGDDVADERQVLFTGWPRGDTHGTISNLRYGLDNQVLGSVGYNGFRGAVGGVTFGRGADAVSMGAGYFRFAPDGSSLDYLARTSNNTWGVAQSEDGHVFGSTANRNASNFVHIPGRHYRRLLGETPTLPRIADREDVYPLRNIYQVDQFGMYTAGSAHEIYTARAYPPEYWNRAAFVAEPTAHLVGMFELEPAGTGFRAVNRWNLVASRDAWQAPVQVKVGPDGAVWISDFYSLVAQHNPTPEGTELGPGNAYETPNRDKIHGRIYRVVHEDAPPPATTSLAGATPARLVAALTDDNMFWRLTAQRLLVERGQTDVVPALTELLRDHTVDALGLNPGALHALWTLHGLGALEADTEASDAARLALHHPSSALRRAALAALPRDERLLADIFAAGLLPDRSSPHEVDLTVSSGVLQDADPHVRLDALLALAELPPSPRAVDAVVELITVPGNARDRWLPDAAAMAGIQQGPDAALALLRRERLPVRDSAAMAGIQTTLRRMTIHFAARENTAAVVALLQAVPEADPALAEAVFVGIAGIAADGEQRGRRGIDTRGGWPEEQPPTLTAEQRSALAAAARSAPPEMADGFARVAARWGTPDLFR